MISDRTVPLLVTVGELEALIQSVGLMLGALEAEQNAARQGLRRDDPEVARAVPVLRALEIHLAKTLEAARAATGS